MGIIKGILKAPIKVAKAPIKVAEWGAETAVDTEVIGGSIIANAPAVGLGLVVGKNIGKIIRKQHEKDKKKPLKKL